MHLIVDGYNIAFRSYFVYDVQQGLKTEAGIPTGIVFGFLKTLLKWKSAYPKHDMVVVWDSPGGKEARQEMFPQYKASREKNFEVVEFEEKDLPISTHEDSPTEVNVFTLQIEILQNMLESLGISQASAYKTEADDVIATLVRKEFKDEPNIILTSDRDMLQLISSNTVLITPKGKAYDRDLVKEEYGVPPEHLLTFRSLSGDKSDELPGLPYFRRKVIATLVNANSGKLDSIYNAPLETELTDKELEKLASFKDQAFLNYRVMNFIDADYDLVEGSKDTEELTNYCEVLELTSIKSELIQFGKKRTGFLKFNNKPLIDSD